MQHFSDFIELKNRYSRGGRKNRLDRDRLHFHNNGISINSKKSGLKCSESIVRKISKLVTLISLNSNELTLDVMNSTVNRMSPSFFFTKNSFMWKSVMLIVLIPNLAVVRSKVRSATHPRSKNGIGRRRPRVSMLESRTGRQQGSGSMLDHESRNAELTRAAKGGRGRCKSARRKVLVEMRSELFGRRVSIREIS
jgi:hypothetical protein